MPLRSFLPALLLLTAGFSPAQEQAGLPVDKSSAPKAAVPLPPKDDGTRVSILGYHEFSSTLAPSQMRIRTATFRKQMEALKNLGLPVIPLEDLLAWKKGVKFIPPRSVVLTLDDGWKSVYTEAFPILKEFRFPFTIYLYKNYVDGGGRALTTAMIKEMQQHGCTIGSHSVSHPFPGTVKYHAKKGDEAYDKFLRREFGESRRFLEAKFGQNITTYAYPGGYYTETMYPIAEEYGYDYLFTVLPGKIRRDLDNRRLPRYIIHGNSDLHFEQATTFKSILGTEALVGAVVQTTPHPVVPEPGSRIESRLPSISADLSGVENLDAESIVMRVSGFGRVKHKYEPDTSQLSWTVNRRLRHRVCEVNVQWRLKGRTKYESPLRWSFLIEREAAYQVGAGE
ncbi:MAG: polysaccharide deacetylase family protein [Roseibacillus sp.]